MVMACLALLSRAFSYTNYAEKLKNFIKYAFKRNLLLYLTLTLLHELLYWKVFHTWWIWDDLYFYCLRSSPLYDAKAHNASHTINKKDIRIKRWISKIEWNENFSLQYIMNEIHARRNCYSFPFWIKL